MDSKYTLLNSSNNNNRIVLPKFNIKSKPTPIVFNTSTNPPSPKKIKLQASNNDPIKAQQTICAPKQSIQDQRRSLPIYTVRNRLLDEIRKHQTLIIIGETGSGKTTQIPQFIYSARLQDDGQIGITQPRRVAAVSIAMRVAQEMNMQVGDIVGYTVRFEDATNRRTKIKYLTDGMLLREAMVDSLLLNYSVLILDEAHERTIHTDVLFGIVKQAQKLRQDRKLTPLKLLVMSATMDVDHFSNYFNNAAVVYVEGRTHPVDVFNVKEPQEDYQYSCLVVLFKIHREAPADHDVLIFLTGQEEIDAMVSAIYSISRDPDLSKCPAIKVYPLYASLSPEHQLEVFRPTPPNVRKIILSTNIAETSVTITGIKYVIDSGMVKARTYRAASGLDYLKVQKISQAQAWQRTGRAGRDSKGTCYRMFTKTEFQQMAKATRPEIQRCNLSSVALQLLALGVHAASFDFMDKPPPDAIEHAFKQLTYLGAVAVDKNNMTTLTELGRNMAHFPLDPRFSRILLAAKDYGCTEEILSIVAVLSSESVVSTPSSKREQAFAARQKFTSPYGDHITLLNIYRAFNNAGQKKHWCFENFLNFRNLNYAREVRTQLAEICQRCAIPVASCGNHLDQVRKCLIAGLFMNVAELYRNQVHGSHFVTLDSNQVVAIHPSSVLHGMKPQCVIFTEIVHTSSCYLRFVSTIEPEWLAEIAPEYMKTHHLSSAVRATNN